MLCEIHNKEFKGPNSKGNYWHVLDYAKGEYCNKPVSEVETKPEYTAHMVEKSEEIREKLAPEEKVDWEAKNRQSMAQTAMKSASEIVAALISVDKEGTTFKGVPVDTTVKDMANEFFKELKKMKAEE